MRILYFSRDYTPHDHRFLAAIAESGHEVFYLRLENRGRQLEDRPVPDKVQLVHWRGGKKTAKRSDFLPLLFSLKKVIGEIHPDVIHAGPIQTTAFLTALSGFKPLVSMSWGSDLLKDADRNWRSRFATRFTLRHSTLLLGDCEAVREKAVEFGFPKERVVLFPWGIDLNRFTPARNDDFRQRRGWQNEFVVLSLRSMEPLYGVDLVAKGFVRAAQQEPALRLLLLGSGSQAAGIRQLISDYGLEDRVFWGGQVNQEQLPAYYQAADLYISASHSDGSSVSLLEAFASGLPVLVSDIPGNREWVSAGQQGWFFADGDDQAITDGILEAYRSRENRASMCTAARTIAEERADWSKNSAKLLTAYQLATELKR